MSSTIQVLAEARAAREDRERIERTSEDDVRTDLAIAGFTRDQNTYALRCAKHNGCHALVNAGHTAIVSFDGCVYSVVIHPVAR